MNPSLNRGYASRTSVNGGNGLSTNLQQPAITTVSIMKRATCLLVCLVGNASAFLQAAETPNIVLILADDMGYGDVQHLNPGSKIPTPNLNRLAASGVTFSDAHSPSSVCTPTRYGLLTGRYCWRSSLKKGVLGGYSKPLLEPGRLTLANLLKKAGYRTGAVGKWHLGMDMPTVKEQADRSAWEGDPGIDFAGTISDSPIHHGFDYFFGVSASLDMAPYVYVRNDRFTQPPTQQQQAVKFPHFVRSGPRAEDFVIDQVLDRLTNEATKFIRESASEPEPYFLYLPLTGPHKPTQPHERFRGATSLNEYGDFVHQVDWTVGEVLAAIEETGEGDDTLVVFTSDNGSYMYSYEDPEKIDHVEDASVQGYRSDHHRSNGPLRGTKADIWEAGHRVPTFARWPSKIQAGSACDATICYVDFYATFAELIGSQLAEDQAEDSFSIVPLLEDASATRPQPVIHHSVAGMFAIRDGKWKLVAGNGSGGREAPQGKPFAEPYQLFNLDADLSETQDVAAENPQVVTELANRLEEIRNRNRSR